MARRQFDQATLIVYGVFGAIFVFSVYSAQGSTFSLGDLWGLDGLLFRWGVYGCFSICAIVVDSIAVSMVAQWFGDSRPVRLGRRQVKLRPHADTFGTYIIPFASVIGLGFPFGWAKAIELNPMVYKRKWQIVVTRMSGIVANLLVSGLLVFIAFSFFYDSAGPKQDLSTVGYEATMMAAAACGLLAILYLVPIYPLAGSAWLEAVMPHAWRDRYYKIRPWLIIGFGVVLLLATRVFTSIASELLNWWFGLFANWS